MGSSAEPALPTHRLPLFRSFAGYRRDWIRSDLIAALTVWAVLVPEALAYATLAGVPPVVGLYAAPAALVLYAALGSSRHLVVGPMSGTAALSGAIIANLATAGSDQFVTLTVGLALATGVAGLIAGVARLGFVASFISEPVLKGFIIGLALTIIVGQLPKLIGVPAGEGGFFEKLWDLVSQLGDIQGWAALVGLSSLGVIFALGRYAPRVPASLVVVILGVAVVTIFDLDERGVAIVGAIDPGFPDFGLPDLGWSDYGSLSASAVGVLLVGFAEGLGAAKAYAARHHNRIDPNRELLGLGAANLGAGLSSGMVVNGSLSKTAINVGSGARSQMSGLVVAALTVVTLLFLTDLFERLPEATLAAVVVAAVVRLVDVGALVRLYRVFTAELGRIYGHAARPDFIAAVAAMVGVLVFDTLPGLFIGIAVSVLLLAYRASRPNIAILGRRPGQDNWVDAARHPDASPAAGVLVVRPEGGLFYFNAEAVGMAIRAHLDPQVRAVVVDAQSIPVVDVTAVGMLVELSSELRDRGMRLLVARDIDQVRDLLERAGATELVEHVYLTVGEAVDAAVGGGGI